MLAEGALSGEIRKSQSHRGRPTSSRLAAPFAVALAAVVFALVGRLLRGALGPRLGLGADLLVDGLAVLSTFLLTRRLFAPDESTRSVPGYELLEPLGRGGMGEVWRARHRFLARPAAIKLIRLETLGDATESRGAIARFEREAQVIARLHDPHTVLLYDFGRTEDGRLFYAMELLEGMDLWTMIERHGAVRPARVIYLLRQACWSLAEAHAKGIVHRDVKPDNIYACRIGMLRDFVKVLDFGLVKQQRAHDPKLTADGYVTGTPGYIAPEALLGRAIDGRSDLYSLGCVAYFLLTGHAVFEGLAGIDLALAHAQKAPTPISDRAQQKVPADLEAVVMRLLEKDPDKRPRTARDLVALLDGCADAHAWSQNDASAWWDENVELIYTKI
jgi:serine/threonine protein kinase